MTTEFSAAAGQQRSPYPHQLDPASAAKQIAELNMARSRALGQSPAFSNNMPPNSALGAQLSGLQPGPPPMLGSSLGVAQSNLANVQPNQGPDPSRPRSSQFLRMLADFMHRIGTPLPPSLTGQPTPTYDAANSRFQIIETTPEPGRFRLAGGEVSLENLFMVVTRTGGHARVGTYSPSHS
jgi:SWI/SNF chromatin-remodeling complex subunit SWI1